MTPIIVGCLKTNNCVQYENILENAKYVRVQVEHHWNDYFAFARTRSVYAKEIREFVLGFRCYLYRLNDVTGKLGEMSGRPVSRQCLLVINLVRLRLGTTYPCLTTVVYAPCPQAEPYRNCLSDAPCVCVRYRSRTKKKSKRT